MSADGLPPQRLVLLSGGSRGLGAALAAGWRGEGWRVLTLSRTEPPDTPPGDWIRADLADPVAAAAALSAALAGIDPASVAALIVLHNAATLLTDAPAGDFQLSARVRVRFAGTFDAGVLFLRHDRETWAKLCFEFSPRGQGMIVSVVNNRVSDDANAFPNRGAIICPASFQGAALPTAAARSASDATPCRRSSRMPAR